MRFLTRRERCARVDRAKDRANDQAAVGACSRPRPHHCRGSRSGASRTRTGGLLGAIQALAGPEFGLFAGFSIPRRPGWRPRFLADFRSFPLGSGQNRLFGPISRLTEPTSARLGPGFHECGSDEVHRSHPGGHTCLLVPGRRPVGVGGGDRIRAKRTARWPSAVRRRLRTASSRYRTKASGKASVSVRAWHGRGRSSPPAATFSSATASAFATSRPVRNSLTPSRAKDGRRRRRSRFRFADQGGLVLKQHARHPSGGPVMSARSGACRSRYRRRRERNGRLAKERPDRAPFRPSCGGSAAATAGSRPPARPRRPGPGAAASSAARNRSRRRRAPRRSRCAPDAPGRGWS